MKINQFSVISLASPDVGKLVNVGVTTQSTLQDPSNNIQPDYYTNQVSDILELLGQ